MFLGNLIGIRFLFIRQPLCRARADPDGGAGHRTDSGHLVDRSSIGVLIGQGPARSDALHGLNQVYGVQQVLVELVLSPGTGDLCTRPGPLTILEHRLFC